MKKTLIFLLLTVILASFSLAALEDDVKTYSSQVQGKELPAPFGSLFANEQMNIEITKSDNKVLVVGVETKNKKVTSVKSAALPKPTILVYASEATVNKIKAAKNPVAALQLALKNKEITYKGVGLFKKIKLGFMKFFSGSIPTPPKDQTKPAENKTPPAKPEPKKEAPTPAPKNDTKATPPPAKPEPKTKTHIVEMRKDGFVPKTLNIKKGDTVTWKNPRTGRISQAFVIGARQCRHIKSKILKSGEEFSHTFTKTGECTIVDGIVTTIESKIFVTE